MLRFTRSLVALLATGLALTACGGGKPAASPSPAVRAGLDCEELTADGKPVHFGKDAGADLYGLVFGTGKTGIVILHMYGDDVCQPTPFAKVLAGDGYRVLVFDFAGFGVSTAAGASRDDQVAAAVATLRGEGVADVALVGGSMGATTTLGVAADIKPPLKAVVALSPPISFDSDNSISGAARLTMPALIACGEYEPDYPGYVKDIGDAIPKSVPHTVTMVSGSSSHGLALTDPYIGDKAFAQSVVDFLKKYAPVA
ncbi:alpha/beta fold hydrolase [Hamadaea tsunoensis]|uniref:alpha/beta fold hydrolase n=1 Tax=Hamadaea tsunoensis TaxID=53368 RepID=UPI000A009851|nr:alpha/beta fold hydrolase [Hamadaea tsunoensis]